MSTARPLSVPAARRRSGGTSVAASLTVADCSERQQRFRPLWTPSTKRRDRSAAQTSAMTPSVPSASQLVMLHDRSPRTGAQPPAVRRRAPARQRAMPALTMRSQRHQRHQRPPSRLERPTAPRRASPPTLAPVFERCLTPFVRAATGSCGAGRCVLESARGSVTRRTTVDGDESTRVSVGRSATIPSAGRVIKVGKLDGTTRSIVAFVGTASATTSTLWR